MLSFSTTQVQSRKEKPYIHHFEISHDLDRCSVGLSRRVARRRRRSMQQRPVHDIVRRVHQAVQHDGAVARALPGDAAERAGHRRADRLRARRDEAG